MRGFRVKNSGKRCFTSRIQWSRARILMMESGNHFRLPPFNWYIMYIRGWDDEFSILTLRLDKNTSYLRARTVTFLLPEADPKSRHGYPCRTCQKSRLPPEKLHSSIDSLDGGWTCWQAPRSKLQLTLSAPKDTVGYVEINF